MSASGYTGTAGTAVAISDVTGLQAALDAKADDGDLTTKADLASPTFTGTVAGITKSMVGLGSVDNTADTDKPVSAAAQTALDLKAPLASPTFTGTVAGITKSMVGLGSVDNTADAAKTLAQSQITSLVTDLGLKAPLASPTFIGVPAAPTAAAATNTTQVATTAHVFAERTNAATLTNKTLTTPAISSPTGLVKADVGLSSVDNTADTAKPISTLTQAALNALGVQPSDYGLTGWTYPMAYIQGGTVMPTAGLAHVARVRTLSAVITNIHFHLTVGGSSLTSGQCFAAVYNDAGALLGAGAVTGSLHASGAAGWGDGGFKTIPLSVAQGATAGAWYRVLWWFNGTTGPTNSRALNSSSAALNGPLAAPAFMYSTANAALTTTAPANIGTQTGGATATWVGFS